MKKNYLLLTIVASLIVIPFVNSASTVSLDYSTVVGVYYTQLGTNTHPWPLASGCRVDNTGGGSELVNCSYQQQRNWFSSSGLKIARMDVDFKSNTLNPGTGVPFNSSFFTTFAQSNYASAPLIRNQTQWLYANGYTVYFDAFTTPNWNANRAPGLCSGSGSDNATCPSSNLTQTYNTVYAWLEYHNASQGTTWVGSRNEPYAVTPSFYLNNWSQASRCAAVNQSILVSYIVNETNATWNAVDAYNTAYGASVKKVFPAPYTMENGTGNQESCEFNVSILVARQLLLYHDDYLVSTHDYYNNNEFDTSNSYDWMIQRQTNRETWCAAVSGLNCSTFINGEFNTYNTTAMYLNNDKLYSDNLLALLYTMNYLHVDENWTMLNFEWTTVGNRSYESSNGTVNYYNMVSDPLVDNQTTKVYQAFQDAAWASPYGANIYTAAASASNIKAGCSYSAQYGYRCLVANKGNTEETNIVIDASGLGTSYNVTAAVNGRNGTVYPVSTTLGGGNITISSIPEFGAVLLNLTVTQNQENIPAVVRSEICSNSGAGIGELASWLPILGLIMGAAVVMGAIYVFQNGMSISLDVGGMDLGTVAIVFIGAAITISIAARIIVSALC